MTEILKSLQKFYPLQRDILYKNYLPVCKIESIFDSSQPNLPEELKNVDIQIEIVYFRFDGNSGDIREITNYIICDESKMHLQPIFDKYNDDINPLNGLLVSYDDNDDEDDDEDE